MCQEGVSKVVSGGRLHWCVGRAPRKMCQEGAYKYVSEGQGRIQGGGVTWVMTPPWGLGHHRPARGTTGLSGAPQA